VNAIRKYTQLVNGIDEQIVTINDARKENTGVIGGVGDWVGEKMGAYSTGKESYESQIQQAQDRAKTLHAQMIAEFSGKTISESEQKSIDVLVQKLEKSTGAKLEHVSWAKATFNSIGADDIQGDAGSLVNRMKIAAKTSISAVEGGVEGITGIVEMTGKAIGICTAYIASAVSEGKFDSSVGKQISADVTQIFSLLTLENAKKALALLPKALESFASATPDVQAEGFGKFFGMILAPLGIGAKVVQAGKAISIVGVTGMKAGAKTAERAAKIVARQYERVSGPSERAMNVAKKAGMAGVAAMSLGTGEVALAGTAIAGGTAVQYIGEMGAGGKGKISEKALAEMTQAEKVAKAETRSGVSRETVL
jgi:hypothetical protein